MITSSNKAIDLKESSQVGHSSKDYEGRPEANSTIEKFDFDDILLEPSQSSEIRSRYNDINLGPSLPVITAPMDTVVNIENMPYFLENNIQICLPRGERMVDLNKEVFISISLEEFEDMTEQAKRGEEIIHKRVCIDVANGHMVKMHEAIASMKEHNPSMLIMAGNIGSPKGYLTLAEAGADYIRCGIGFGGGCFIDGTKVKTKNGYKNIEDIVVEDLVLTIDGSYKEVISTVRYESEEELIEVNGEVCTVDHEFFVINNKDIESINEDNYEELGFWIEAKNIDPSVHSVIEIVE